jgi:hypothetical protein
MISTMSTANGAAMRPKKSHQPPHQKRHHWVVPARPFLSAFIAAKKAAKIQAKTRIIILFSYRNFVIVAF